MSGLREVAETPDDAPDWLSRQEHTPARGGVNKMIGEDGNAKRNNR